MFSYNRLLFLIDHLIWGILIVVFVFFIFQSEYFLTERNISNILAAAAVLGEVTPADKRITIFYRRRQFFKNRRRRVIA